jgi:hypothetical protein
VWVTSGAPSGTGRAPTRAMNSGEAPGVVGSAWVTIFLCGGDGRRKLGLRLRFHEI